MTININKINLRYFIVCALLFFAAMNFQAKFFYFVYLSLFFVCLIQKKLLVNYSFGVYFLLGVIMSIYNSDEGALSMLRCFAPASLYLVGFNIISFDSSVECTYNKGKAQKYGYILLATISAGSFFHYLLNFATNYNKFIGRNTNDIWTGEMMAATGQTTLACLMLGLSVAMIFAPIKKYSRIVGILSILCILLYNLILAGRTVLVVLLVLIVLAVFYMRKALKSAYSRIKLLIGCVISILAVAIAFLYDIFGIRSYVVSSNLFLRFGSSLESFGDEAYRTSSKLLYLSESYKYPFGGLNLRAKYGYAHDLLLDGYDEYGLIGFLLLLAILCICIRALYHYLKYTDYDYKHKLSFLCVYASIFLIFYVEPILAGMPWLFACFSMMNGCLEAMNNAYFKSGGDGV